MSENCSELPQAETDVLYSTVWEIHTTPSLPREATTANSGHYCVNESFGRGPTQANKGGNQIGRWMWWHQMTVLNMMHFLVSRSVILAGKAH